MSQYDYGTIDPNAKSGTQLAVDLNNWRDALHSGHRGAARPLYAQAGMMWIRETSAEQWDLMLYDGDTDFVLRSVNPTTNQLIGIPQSAVSGLSEIATATAELEGKADDLEVRAGGLESGLANLGGDFQALDSQIDFTIIYPNGGSAESPANAAASTRYPIDNPFPGHSVIPSVEILHEGKWGQIDNVFAFTASTIDYSYGASARRLAGGGIDEIVVQTARAAAGAANGDGNPWGATGPVAWPKPFRVVIHKSKGAIA